MTQTSRTEHDLLGTMKLPADALHGIHTARARRNFSLSERPVHPALIEAYGAVKLACAEVNHSLGHWEAETYDAVAAACRDMMDGSLNEHVCVDALQGGAGTSTNMNVNEVLANRALSILGYPPGTYDVLHPLHDLNRHQSTNDTYPTALRVAAIRLVRNLEQQVAELGAAFQRKEQEFADVVKIGRTQLQDAVLVTLGREMGAYAEAFSRDRWRMHKCEERLRVINLGGTAIGSGLGAPRRYIFRVADSLRRITGLGLARAENLVDGTQNADAFVEVSGILKALATSLLKCATDLRLLSSGPRAGLGEVKLPPVQAGSSIMPSKVNPVIPEAVSQAAMTVLGNDQIIAQACAAGSLELNPFLPLVADRLLENATLLANACTIFTEYCVNGLKADRCRCRREVDGATATATALVSEIGYESAQEVARKAAESGTSIRETVIAGNFLSAEEFDRLTSPEAVMRLGS